MQATRKVLNRIMNVLAGVSLIAMTALTCWQVFTRYVLNNPSTWSEDWWATCSPGPACSAPLSSPGSGAT